MRDSRDTSENTEESSEERKATLRVVTFGEMLLRLSPPNQERLFQSPQLRTWFGGSEANVAVSLARFGLQCDYVTRLPENAIGHAAVRALRAEGVNTDHIVYGGSKMGMYFVESGAEIRPLSVVYDRSGSSFSESNTDTFAWRKIIGGASWLHISGITPGLSKEALAVVNVAMRSARDAAVLVSLDLNYRAALWEGRDPKPIIRPLAEQAHLLIGNAVAVKEMLGEEANAEQLTETFGCGLVALTNREHISASEHGWSATLYDAINETKYESPRYQVRLVDRVGGGDAFAAGLIYGLMTGRGSQGMLDFATAAGALKLTIPGDWNLASVAEVDRVAAEKRQSGL